MQCLNLYNVNVTNLPLIMIEVIEQFVYDRLNYKINFTDPLKDEYLYNGTIIAELLYNYDIINISSFALIQPTSDPEIIANNYKYIREWLLTINIDISEDICNDLIAGKTSTLINIFYELYLTLNDRFYLYNNRRKSVKVEKKCNELIERLSNINILKKILVTNEDKIDWKKLSYRKLLECYKAKKEEYGEICKDANKIASKTIINHEETSDIPNPLNDSLIDVSCNELLEELINIDNLDKFEYEDVDQSKRFLQKIRKNIREKEKLNIVRYKLNRILLQKLWQVIVKKQNRIFEKNLRDSILKQAVNEAKEIKEQMQRKEGKELHLEKVMTELKSSRERENKLFTEKLLKHPQNEDKYIKKYYQELCAKLRQHRNLYEKKLAEKKERYTSFCEDVFNNLVDVAIKFGEYRKEHKTNPNWMEQFLWRNMFVDGKQVLEKVRSEWSLCSCEEEIEALEEIDVVDTNILVDNLFRKYLNYEEPFTLDYVLHNQVYVESSRLGANVLGHIVHLLLLSKYPKPSVPEPTDIPSVNVAACLIGLTDILLLPHLKKLLMEKNIVTIVMDDCIQYCIDAFKNETVKEYEDPSPPVDLLDEVKTKNKKGKGKKTQKDKGNDKKKEKGKGSNKSKKRDKLQKSDDVKAPQKPQSCDMGLQTPYIYPCENIVLTEKADLGRQVEEYKEAGIELNDELAVCILVQYLKSLQNIKGWVIINFPETIIQAALLEENLTGKPLFNHISQQEGSVLTFNQMKSNFFAMKDEDIITPYRRSSLLTNPKPDPPDNYYDTYLTAFITLKEKNADEENVKYTVVYDDRDDDVTEELNPLEEFYTDQGCNYVYYYEKFDFPTVKQIGKLIIGEYTIPPKTSFELFGPNLTMVQTDMTEPVKGAIEKNKDKKAATSKKKKSKKDEAVVKIEMCDKESQVPTPEEETEISLTQFTTKSVIEYSVPEPGEPDWNYISIHMSYSSQYKLATNWENIEENYCFNLKNFLFFHHLNINTHIPYTKYVKRFIEASSVFFDEKQQFIDEFQEIFNTVVECTSNTVQNALYCRIKELRETLLSMTDQQTFYMDSIRKVIINKNWVASQIIELLNLFISCFQLEINRCVETMTFVNRYYNCMIKRRLSKDLLDLDKNTIDHVCTENDIYNVKCIREFVAASLFNTRVNDHMDPVTKIIDSKTEQCNEIITKAKSSSLTYIEDAALLFNSSVMDNYIRYGKTKNYVEPSKEVKEDCTNIFKEWQCAINGEFARTTLRIKLINQISKFEWKNIINMHTKQFYEIRKNLHDGYEKNISNVNKICEMFSCAAKKRAILHMRLILDEASRYITKYHVLFTDYVSEENILFKENYKDYKFTYSKLLYLIDFLYDLAPTGFISKLSFMYVLQDFIECEEGKRQKLLPDNWYNLKSKHIETLMNRLYGKIEIIDWKDFIVRNLYVDFPTHEELLNIREQFKKYDPDGTETITIHDFFNVSFWYETYEILNDLKDYNYVREILIKLFRIDNKKINYTRMLLLFCKDINPIEGFAKAIELSVGNYVCYDYEMGNDFVDIIMSQRYEHDQMKILREQELEDIRDMAQSIVTSTINTTVHLCDSVLIEDYYSEENKDAEMSNESNPIERKSNPNKNEQEDNPSIFSDFTNVSVGFECREYVNMTYILPYKTLRVLMFALLPRMFEKHKLYMDRINIIYEQCKREHFNNEVLIHEFLNNVHFQEILDDVKKFEIEKPEMILVELINEKV